MKTILQLTSSIFGDGGQSTVLARELVEALRAQDPNARVIARDLATDPVPHLTAERFAAFTAEEPTAQEREVRDYSDRLIAELREADLIVVGLPMYNFGVPSQLKAWFDHVARAGVTFRYESHGPVGLLAGRKAIVLATRGGRYAGSALDTQSQWVRDIFAFIGIRDVDFIYVEGLARGGDARADSVAYARTVIRELAGAARAAA
ncbi:MAG TPA: FMN-dependent NADH-azoreductase [Candidatus Limnocylindrales bacterium]|nr:FMN-dependent NADH-azoreductase [Candidatus Limnocylindrales bacterium]